MNVYIVLYRILGLPSLLDFLKKIDTKKRANLTVIWRFHFLVHLLESYT